MPSCFVIMPFGEKELVAGKKIDFDFVYRDLIKKAADSLGLDVIRSDEANMAGWVHKEMINQIARADVCIVDLTTLNPNVFYELGVRHTLRRSVTVLIKHEVFKLPFNIRGMSTIDYNLKNFDRVREKISLFIKNGLDKALDDSLVYDVIPQLNVSTGPEKPITRQKRVRYPVLGRASHAIGLIGGDIRDVYGIPVWVNSENTNMQMARSYDRSISSSIRYLGAKKDKYQNIVRDVIAEDLAEKLGSSKAVHPATVISTVPGELKNLGVRVVLHVAAVQGTIAGAGYKRVDNIHDCVTNVLQKVAMNRGLNSPSVLVPLLGTGMGTGRIEEIAPVLFETALSFLEDNEEADIETVWFLAFTERQWDICTRALNALSRRLGPAQSWLAPAGKRPLKKPRPKQS